MIGQRRTGEREEPAGPSRKGRPSTPWNIPVPLIIVALLLAGILGVQLAIALDRSTDTGSGGVASGTDATQLGGTDVSGLTLVTETTVGPEVQRLIATGMIQPPTGFDTVQCLREQDVEDSILIMEEIAWGAEELPSLLLVHGPMDPETLRATGGTVSATVVEPSCGSAPAGEEGEVDPQDSRLWSGQVMIGSL